MPTAKVQREGVQDLGANDVGRKSIHSQVSRVIASNSQLLAKVKVVFKAFVSMSDMYSDLFMLVSLNSGACWGDADRTC